MAAAPPPLGGGHPPGPAGPPQLDYPPPGTALVEELDKKLLIQVGGGGPGAAPLLQQRGPALHAAGLLPVRTAELLRPRLRAEAVHSHLAPTAARRPQDHRRAALSLSPQRPSPHSDTNPQQPHTRQLRDGRKIIGVLRSFDQFANLVLEEAAERIIVGAKYADIPLGMYLLRGENLVLMGQLDPNHDPPPGLVAVPEAEIREALRLEREEARLKGTISRLKFDFLDGLE